MKKIAVIGSINMDLTAKADRFPNAGETIFGWDLQYVPGGKGNNQAVAAARLGGDVTMFTCVGDDAFGDRLIQNLRDNGVKTDYIRKVKDTATGVAIITVAENDNTIVVISGANNCVTKRYIEEVKDAVLESDIIVLQNEIPLETVVYAAELCHKAGKTVIYNPAPVVPLADGIMENISYLTPNEHEVTLLFPKEIGLEGLLEKCNGKLIVTLGAEGAAAWVNGKMMKIPARKANVVDTTGAGDTFNGAFAYALANAYSMEKALHFANVAASLSTEGFGAQGGMPVLDQVKKALSTD